MRSRNYITRRTEQPGNICVGMASVNVDYTYNTISVNKPGMPMSQDFWHSHVSTLKYYRDDIIMIAAQVNTPGARRIIARAAATKSYDELMRLSVELDKYRMRKHRREERRRMMAAALSTPALDFNTACTY